MNLNSLVEFRKMDFLEQAHRVLDDVGTRLHLLLCRFEFFSHFRHDAYSRTSIPMLTAVPRTVRTAASRLAAFRSGIFSFAMSSTCFFVTVPTLVLLGSFEPFARLAARFSRIDAGGVFVMKV